MKLIKLLFLGLFLLCSFPMFAQNDLTQAEKEAIQDRIRDKVDEFQYHLTQIANKEKLSVYQRQNEVQAAKVLFIGECEPYQLTNEYGELVQRSPVKIELSSTRSSLISRPYVKIYLNNTFKNVHRYGKVEIKAADLVRVDQITKTPTGTYEAMAYYVQKYIAYNEYGKVVYSDITRKKIKVYVNALSIAGEIVWEAKLGDIYVTSTSSLLD